MATKAAVSISTKSRQLGSSSATKPESPAAIIVHREEGSRLMVPWISSGSLAVVGRLCLLLLLAASGLGAAHAAASCPNRGCPMTSAAPVCGADGNTYMSECLAVCQGVKVASRGQCPGSEVNFKPLGAGSAAAPGSGRPRTSTSTITATAMRKYEKEGFRLLGVAASTDSQGAGFRMPLYTPQQIKRMKAAAPKAALEGAMRFDQTTGFLYYAPRRAQLDTGNKTAHVTPNITPFSGGLPINAVAGTRGRRRLHSIFGTDDRLEMFPGCSGYPNTVIGQLTFTVPTKGNYICSAALIDKNTILTAGHCVYSFAAKLWATNLVFWPGRGRAVSNAAASVSPYGGIGAYGATTYRGWTTSGNFQFDIATVHLSTDIGSRIGWTGYWYGNIVGTVYSTGYPGEKLSGSQWQTSCVLNDNNAGDQLVQTSLCDITGGNSGGPLWQYLRATNGLTYPYVMAITSYTMCRRGFCNNGLRCCFDDGVNGWVQLNSNIYNDVSSWARQNG